MNQLEKLFHRLRHQTDFQAGHDGFPSGELRRMLLEKIRPVKLGSYPRGTRWHTLYSRQEKLRIGYLAEIGEIGACRAQEYIADQILLPTGHFLRAIINAGAETIGREIARGYAAEIYPELRRMRLAGESDISLSPPEQDKTVSYGFTVETDRDMFDLSPVRESDAAPGSEIYYDDVCERHIETFAFASVEEADAAHWNWQRFIKHQTLYPPVKYALRIETDFLDRVKIGSVIHADLFEKAHSEIVANGAVVEWNICSTLAEAETLKREKIDELRKTAPDIKSPVEKPEMIQSPEFPLQNREISAISKKQPRNKHFPIGK